MNITRENLSDLDLCIRIDIEESDYAEKVTKQLKNYKNKASVPGFRKGMAPMGMIQRMYKGAIMADEVQNLLNESLFNYIDSEKLDIVGSPLANEEKTGKPDFEKDKNFTFYFDVAVMPEVKIDWSKVNVKMNEVKVDKKEIDTQIDNITRQHGKFETPETIGENDFIYGKAIELDKDGKEKEGGMNVFCSFDVSTIKDDEIRQKFIGMKKDDKVTFAANKAFKTEDLERNFRLDADVAKKFKSEVEMTISGCSHVTPHELDEELFKTVYPTKDIKDADAFRKAVAADIEESYKEQTDILFANQVRRTLIENFDTPMPEAFLKRWILSRNEKEMTAEQLDADWEKSYLPSMKWEFIDHALNKIQPINPSHVEIVEEFKTLIRNNGGVPAEGDAKEQEDSLNRVAESLASDKQNAPQVADRLYHRKLVQLFRDQVKPEVEKITVKEFVNRAKAENENK